MRINCGRFLFIHFSFCSVWLHPAVSSFQPWERALNAMLLCACFKLHLLNTHSNKKKVCFVIISWPSLAVRWCLLCISSHRTLGGLLPILKFSIQSGMANNEAIAHEMDCFKNMNNVGERNKQMRMIVTYRRLGISSPCNAYTQLTYNHQYHNDIWLQSARFQIYYYLYIQTHRRTARANTMPQTADC